MMTSKVLLIYTGGTIGMVKDLETGELKGLDLAYIHNQIPEIAQLGVSVSSLSISSPIDSSDMSPAVWLELSRIISENYEKFDGFVVLHGTDTMAYTAAALSFLIQGIQKPIILTGSQLPIGILRTDGKENLLTSIEIAGKKTASGDPVLKDVAVFFQSKLFKGNRCSKVSANQFDAFDSPNHALLGAVGVEINISPLPKDNPKDEPSLRFYPELNDKIGLMKLFPGMNPKAYECLFNIDHHVAIVIETFGAGNAFSDISFQSMILAYIGSGGVVLNITQCVSGSVQQGKYASSRFFEKAGVISGGDMNVESALTKLMWLYGNFSDIDEIKKLLKESVVGEMN